MGKKKKMTPAQAAAARRDDGRKRPVAAAPVKDDGPKDRGMRSTIGITIAIIAVVIVLSFVYTIGPAASMVSG